MNPETLFAAMLGMASGILTGLAPGFGILAAMLLAIPYMQSISVFDVLVFFSCLLVTTQFWGAFAGIFTGMPGELSSVPASIAGFKLASHGHSRTAILHTAIGSGIGSIIGFVVLLVFFYIFSLLKNPEYLFSNDIKLLLFSITIVSIVVTDSSTWWISTLVFAAGVGLGMIGNNLILGTNILGNTVAFAGGIPFLPVMFGLLVIPGLSMLIQQRLTNTLALSESTEKLTLPWKHISIGTIVGGIVGLIPGTSYILSSNLSYAVSSKDIATPPTDQQYLNQLVSSETANNSGSILALMPLLTLGIPIIPSEAILMEIMYEKGFRVWGQDQTIISNIVPFSLIIISMILINTILAGPVALKFEQKIVALVHSVIKFIPYATITLMLFLGWQEDRLLLWALIILITGAIGTKYSHRVSFFPVVFGLILGPEILITIQRFLIIHDIIY